MSMIYPDDTKQLEVDENPNLRDVTSTARLFNFRRPVYMDSTVWEDCVELSSCKSKGFDELAVLQRLRHVLFMAASALHGRFEDLEYNFRVYRIPHKNSGRRQPEPVNLHLVAHKDRHNQPVITIKFPTK